MTLQNAIARAEKLSGKKIQVDESNSHWVIYKGYQISFRPNGRVSPDVEATNFYTKRCGLSDDIQSDYFAGTFRDNLSQCFKFVDRAVPDYKIIYEANVIRCMEQAEDITTSDAQAILEGKADLFEALFIEDEAPVIAAKKILAASASIEGEAIRSEEQIMEGKNSLADAALAAVNLSRKHITSFIARIRGNIAYTYMVFANRPALHDGDELIGEYYLGELVY